MNPFLKHTILLFAPLFISCSEIMPEERVKDIIPLPVSYTSEDGGYLLKCNVRIICLAGEFSPAAEYLAEVLSPLSPEIGIRGKGGITLLRDPGFAGDAYRLEVSGGGIVLTAGSYGGIISAIASLRQLLPPRLSATGRTRIASVTIEDTPRFLWRGFMLDCSRHFWTKQEVMGVLDLMALYKLNKFHWHLTDDQGWRIEIESYPLLTAKGAWRDPATHANDIECARRAEAEDDPDFLLPADRLRQDGEQTLYGGYYTIDDIREVVAYAARRGIDVIPEIDMPGHSQAAIENYLWLSCNGNADWGENFSAPLCPGKDTTLEFCKRVWSEVFELFPYEYAHIGADEVEKHNWKRCPDCQRRIRENGLKDEFELQAWFVGDMQRFFAENGKKLIGWDEILSGGGTAGRVAYPGATIDWWRAWVPDAPRQAADKGYGIIACPTEWLYLSSAQSRISLDKTYDFEPVPVSFTESERALFLGVQGNIWCETIPTMRRVQYLMFPRFFALSELGWVQPGNKDKTDFNRRVLAHYPRLDAVGVNYRVPDLEGVYDRNVFTDVDSVGIRSPHKGITVRWTDDGTIPSADSPEYKPPFVITGSRNLIFRTFRPDGSAGEILRAPFLKSDFAPAAQLVETFGEGLYAKWYDYDGTGETCRNIEQSAYKGIYETDTVTIPQDVKGNIGLVVEGWLDIPADGIYTFWLNSDDGSILEIGEETVIDNDGAHSMFEKTGQTALSAGLHPIKVLYFDGNGGGLSMGLVGEGGTRLPMDKTWFRRGR